MMSCECLLCTQLSTAVGGGGGRREEERGEGPAILHLVFGSFARRESLVWLNPAISQDKAVTRHLLRLNVIRSFVLKQPRTA